MKKLIYMIYMNLFILMLSGCQPSVNHDFIIPPIEDYQIKDFNYIAYEPLFPNENQSLSEDELNDTVKANVFIHNLSYNNPWLLIDASLYTGSGVIFHETDTYYYVLTNAHVVQQNESYQFQAIEVYDYEDNKYDGFIYEGSIDLELDLSVIVFAKEEELTVLTLANGQVLIDEKVYAIGNPLKKRNVITDGKVVGYNRTIVEDKDGNIHYMSFYAITHNALINDGSSGGMLINKDLYIVGINFASGKDEEKVESFSIPSNLVVSYLNNLISNQNSID